MKKLFLGSISMTAFALAALIFQISCQKEASAQNGSNYTLPPATTSTLGGIIVGQGLTVTNNGTLSVASTSTSGQQQNLILFSRYTHGVDNCKCIEFWTSNLDGTNRKKIPITLPTGLTLGDEARLTPDGQKLIFEVYKHPAGGGDAIVYIYSCSIDGSNVRKLIDESGSNKDVVLLGAY